MKKIVSLILALSMMLALTACGGKTGTSSGNNASSGNETYTLKMALMSADIPVLGDYVEEIKAATNGRVNIEYVDIQSLGKPTDAMAMVRDGAIDMYFNSAAMTGSEFPLLDMFQLPFLCSNPTDCTDLMNAVWHAGYLDKELADFEPMFFISTDMQMIFTKDPINSLKDFSGKKIRAVSGVGASFVESTGATVVTMGLGDVYLALSTNNIDGAMSSPVMIRSNAFNETCSYLLDAYVFGGVIMCLMNDDCWAKLPSDIQAAILKVNADHADWSKWNQTAAMLENQEYLTSNGMKLVPLSDADMAAMKAGCANLESEWIKKVTDQGYNGQEIMDFAKERLEYFSLGK